MQSFEDKNFGLTSAEFEKLRLDLQKNDTNFFEVVFLKQFIPTVDFLKSNFQASHEDAYDAVMECLLFFRSRFVNGKLRYGNLRSLFLTIAKQKYLQSKENKKKEIQNSVLIVAEPEESEEILKNLEKAFNELGDSCKDLLTKHYYGKMQLNEIALLTGKQAPTVRKQKERCINHLKTIFFQKAKAFKHE